MNDQIKSRKRISAYGEVNTAKKEINEMLDLVKQETERLDSRFLEPACGDGNFLMEILNRKLVILVKNFKKNQYEFEKNLIVIIGSIYGIDILIDNIQSTQNRLYHSLLKVYKKYFNNNFNDELMKTVLFILKKNIIHGDALTLKHVDEDKPIIFSEWAIVDNKLKRRDFTFSNLLAHSPSDKGMIFSDMGDEVILSSPVKEFSLVKFDKGYEYSQ